jgi:diguanylate cyclase (GGDEF)-like protein
VGAGEPATDDFFREEQTRQLDRVNQLRFMGATAFFGLFVMLGVVLRLAAWKANLSLFFAYWIFSGAILWAARRSALIRRNAGLAVALLDMPVVFFLQLSTFPTSDANGVAGFTIGIYVFLLLLAALTLEPWALGLTTVSGIFFEGMLQHLAKVDPGAIVASAILLTLSALACGYGRNRLLEFAERLALIAKEQQMLKDLAQKTQDQALMDSLTGLYNRQGFVTLAQRQLASAALTGLRYVVIFMDLDGLKVINDNLGHAEGDQAIREAALVIRQTLREADIVARLGGDEFVALAAESVGASPGAAPILERIAERMTQVNAGGTRTYRLQMSIGVAPFDPSQPRPLDTLLAEADAAMYAEKKKRPSRRDAQVLIRPARALIESLRPIAARLSRSLPPWRSSAPPK